MMSETDDNLASTGGVPAFPEFPGVEKALPEREKVPVVEAGVSKAENARARYLRKAGRANLIRG